MNRDITLSATLAASLHLVVLFGFTLEERNAVQAVEAATYVEVDLTAAEPEPVLVEAAEEAPLELPPPESEPIEQEIAAAEPEPEPVVELPEPDLEMVTQEIPMEIVEPVIEQFVPPPAVEPVIVETAPPPVTEAAVTSFHSERSPANPAPSDSIELMRLTEPKYRKKVDVYYPRLSKQRKEAGLVVLTLLINPAGKAEKIEVKESSGFPLLDQAATDAARRSAYFPALTGNRPVAYVTEASYRFVLLD
jgi:periplasmic protein TonB